MIILIYLCLFYLPAYYGYLFTDHSEAAFSNYRLWESLGFILAFGYGNFVRTDIKLYLTFTVLVVGMYLYGVTEYLERRARRSAANISEKTKLWVRGGHPFLWRRMLLTCSINDSARKFSLQCKVVCDARFIFENIYIIMYIFDIVIEVNFNMKIKWSIFFLGFYSKSDIDFLKTVWYIVIFYLFLLFLSLKSIIN